MLLLEREPYHSKIQEIENKIIQELWDYFVNNFDTGKLNIKFTAYLLIRSLKVKIHLVEIEKVIHNLKSRGKADIDILNCFLPGFLTLKKEPGEIKNINKKIINLLEIISETKKYELERLQKEVMVTSEDEVSCLEIMISVYSGFCKKVENEL